MLSSVPDNNKNGHSKVNHRRRLALLLLGSFFATQAAQHPGDLLNFRRLIPKRRHDETTPYTYQNNNDNEDNQDDNSVLCLNPATAATNVVNGRMTASCTASSAIQALVESSLAEKYNVATAALSYRGGYKDEVTVEADANVAVGTLNVVEVERSENSDRIDVEAKAKEYGELEFSLFQTGDGSDEDPEGIPDRYLRMQMQDRPQAKKACSLTLEWRAEHGIDHILKDPHPDFDVCKAVFPHSFITRDVEGHIVFLQRPALINFDLAVKNGLEKEQLLAHYVYVNEYLWQILEADSPLATMTSIVDLYGLNFAYMRQSDLVSFLKTFVKTMDQHFPQRSHKTLIINAPKWFNVLYKILSPLMRESTKAKIAIYSNGRRQDEALQAQVGKEEAEKLLPKTCWTRQKKHHRKHHRKHHHQEEEDDDVVEMPVIEELPTSDFEFQLRNFTLMRLEAAGLSMKEVIPVDLKQ